MKALIFAAGLGTRLRPLTNTMPKALVPVQGKPLLQHCIERLGYFGITEIVINAHHFADQIIRFIAQYQQQNPKITLHLSDERDLLRNTGGGLKHAQHFFANNETFLVCNVDILSNIDIHALYEYHQQQQAIATLAVRTRSTSRYLLFNTQQQLCGWTNIKTKAVKMARPTAIEQTTRFAFSGIQLIEPAIFKHIQQQGAFSIIDVYLHVAKTHTIAAYQHNTDIWLDVGKPHTLAQAETLINQIPPYV